MSGVSLSPWLSRRRRVAIAALFSMYLLFIGMAIPGYSHGVGEAVGFVLLGVFAATYLTLVDRSPELGRWGFAGLLGLMCAVMLAEIPFARAIAFTLSLYVTTVLAARFGKRALPVVFAIAIASLLIPPLVPSWHDTLLDSLSFVTPIAAPVVALVSLGIQEITTANVALAEARAEVARLSAEAERARIARDLHDLLGHSLTTITVKAGLAHRIAQADPPRALTEIAEVEDLARRSLQDVRAAVAGYHDVTLAGELASGRELLRAAGITAELPTAVDIVDPAHQELLGWVVREGLTNVVRHAHAETCAVRLSRHAVEIVDDGVGTPAAASTATTQDGNGNGHGNGGHGLTGLRERVASAGGALECGPHLPAGWRLRVSLPADAAS